MHDQRDLTQDAVLRAQIATANRFIAQSAAIARAHSAIGRAIESLRAPDGEGPSG
jgi:predicted metal-dependent hydrolase